MKFMTPDDEPESIHHAFTNDRRNIEEAAYWFGMEGKTEGEVADTMQCTIKQAGELKKQAKAQGLIDAFNPAKITNKEHLEYVESLGLCARLSKRLRELHPHFLELKIFDSGGTGRTDHDIELRLEQFSRNSATWLKTRLKKSQRAGVSWGLTIRKGVEQLPDVDVGKAGHVIEVIPTCGEPLGKAAGTASSSRVACFLGQVLNSHGKHYLSLAGIPAMIARKFQDKGRLPVIQEFLEESPAYRRIFNGEGGALPLIEQLDTILTSVATRIPLRMAGNELLKIANVEKADWDLFVGDIGGVLLEKDKLTEAETSRITAVRALWTGIKPEHYALVAKKAFGSERERQKKKNEQKKEMPFTPGVIVLAIGEKSSAILRAIELGWVNRLACDRDLAEKIATVLGMKSS